MRRPDARIARAALLAAMFLFMGAGDPALVKSRAAEKKYRKGDLDAALKLFEEARAARPGTSALDYNVGVVKYRKGSPEEAEREFSTALAAGDSKLRASSYYNLGNCLFDKKDYDAAAKAYRKSLELASDDRDAKHNLELALQRKEEQAQQQPQPSPDQKKQDQEKQQQNQDQGAGSQDQPQEDQGNQGKDQEQQSADERRSGADSSGSPESRSENEQQQGGQQDAALDPNAMKPEDARRLLDALRDEEARALEATRERNAQEAGVTRDW